MLTASRHVNHGERRGETRGSGRRKSHPARKLNMSRQNHARRHRVRAHRRIGNILLLTCAFIARTSAAHAVSSPPFPEAEPESVGIVTEALDLLTERVQALAESEQIVGGEIHVIKNRSTVLHQAFGWKDRETEQPLDVDSIYCLRSLAQHISDPSKLHTDAAMLGADDPRLTRVPSAYSGGTGFWAKIWGPSTPSVFATLPARPNLYATTTDYARFLTLQFDDKTDFIGQNGSDGVHAWAWPQHDLIVLFFTQSLGKSAGLGLERILETLLIDQNLTDPSLKSRPFDHEEFERIKGLYWDADAEEAYFAVLKAGENLIIEQPGWGQLLFQPDHTPGRYLQGENLQKETPRHWAEFVFDHDGEITALRMFLGNRPTHNPRHRPTPYLPHFTEILESVRQAHHIDRLRELGVIRLSGTLRVQQTEEMQQTESQIDYLLDTDRERIDLRLEGWTETLLTGNGTDRFLIRTTPGFTRGPKVVTILTDHPIKRLGDWSDHYQHVEVLKRATVGSISVFLVRVVHHDQPGATLFIEEETGLVVRRDALVLIPQAHFGSSSDRRQAGIQTRYENFRDVGGMVLPFRRVTALTLLKQGALSERRQIVTTIARAEVDVEVPPETFLSFNALDSWK